MISRCASETISFRRSRTCRTWPTCGTRRNVNGQPINPMARLYPRDFINTGFSTIDVLMTLIRGQKLPIFSGNGLPHNRLAIQIASQAKLMGADNFAVVFAGIRIRHDDATAFSASIIKLLRIYLYIISKYSEK